MTPSDMTIYLLAFIGLVCSMLFGFVWVCAVFRILWLYANYSARKAMRAHRACLRIKARTKAAWKEWGIEE